MNIAGILQFMFPGIDLESQVRLEDDGTGPRIAVWNYPSPQPTMAEIEANEKAATNRQQWATQAQARKNRDARKVLALPDSEDPAILKQKLNAALALLNVR